MFFARLKPADPVGVLANAPDGVDRQPESFQAFESTVPTIDSDRRIAATPPHQWANHTGRCGRRVSEKFLNESLICFLMIYQQVKVFF